MIDYASTKGAIVSFTKALAAHLIPQGIRVNAVAYAPIPRDYPLYWHCSAHQSLTVGPAPFTPQSKPIHERPSKWRVGEGRQA